jgi:UDP-glucose 4-epimerase
VRNGGLLDVTAQESRFLNFGRVVDTTRLREEFGYSPRLSTSDTVDEFLAGARPLPKVALAGIGVGSRLLQARRDRHRFAVTGA